MTLFQTTVGIDIAASGLRIAAVQSRIGGFHLTRFEEVTGFSSMSDAGKADTIRELTQKYNLRQARLFLTLSRELGICREIELPIEAADRVRSAASLQVESLSPWPADEVYWDCATLESAAALKGDKTFRVTICIVPRIVLDPLRRVFAGAGVSLAGVTLARTSTVGADEENPPNSAVSGMETISEAKMSAVDAALQGFSKAGATLNLIPADERFRRSHLQYAVTYALVAALLLLAVLWVVRAPYQWSVYGAELDSEIEKLKPDTNEVAAKEAALDQAKASYETLRTRIESRDFNLEALQEIARVLPADGWISSYGAQGRTVTLSGFAQSASAVQKVLEESPLFEGVQFTSPVTRDPSGKDRFTLRAMAGATP
jgi:general secretion pathway protein L